MSSYRTPLSSTIKKMVRALAMLAIVIVVGVVGYMVIERWDFLDAVYMTVITITTVGFSEVGKISHAGRAFTILLIFMGVAVIAYTLGIISQEMVAFQMRAILGRRKLGSKIKSMKNHYIVCGYGRIGRIIAQELKAKGIPFLVVDHDPESTEALDHLGCPYIIGDATSEDVLLEAGILRAKGLVSIVLSDADNLFITMTARGLNPDLMIVARADQEQSQKKLLRAGANKVVLPYLIGGQKMAHTITKPAVTDFIELTVHDKGIELKMEEVLVGPNSKLDGVKLVDSGIRQGMNIIIVAIRKEDGSMTFNPSSLTRIQAGDTLIALGHSSDLARLVVLSSGS